MQTVLGRKPLRTRTHTLFLCDAARCRHQYRLSGKTSGAALQVDIPDMERHLEVLHSGESLNLPKVWISPPTTASERPESAILLAPVLASLKDTAHQRLQEKTARKKKNKPGLCHPFPFTDSPQNFKKD